MPFLHARRGALAQAVQQVAPGGRLLSERRLRGDLSRYSHLLRIERRDGERST